MKRKPSPPPPALAVPPTGRQLQLGEQPAAVEAARREPAPTRRNGQIKRDPFRD